jgi:hypothetical protein
MERDFSILHSIHTGSGGHSASYSVGTGWIFPWSEASGRVADNWPPYIAKVKNTWSNTSKRPHVFMVWCLINDRHNFTFTFQGITWFEELYLLGYNAMHSVESQPTFRRNMSPPSSGSKNKPSNKISVKAGWLAYFSTLLLEVTCSTETSVDFQRTTRR